MYNTVYKYTVCAMKMHKSEKDGNRTGKKAGPVV
jgi:hypothetical protein